MFRRMRRIKQLLSEDEINRVLMECNTGVLSVIGDGGYPYGVPVNYLYSKKDNAIYLHCAKSGHKLDGIKKCDKVSFTVVEKDEIIPEELTTYFRSVIVFGRAHLIDNKKNIIEISERFGLKFLDNIERVNKEVDMEISSLAVVKIDIENMSGKEAIELVKMR